MAKAQVEIIGLVLILVLVGLGMLFAVKYVFLKPESEIKEDFTQRSIAQNLLDAMLDVNTKCKGETIQNLLIDCNNYKFIDCGEPSCEYVKGQINEIFRKTLDEWNNKYYFEADKVKIGQECSDGKKAGIQSLSSLEIKLDICD